MAPFPLTLGSLGGPSLHQVPQVIEDYDFSGPPAPAGMDILNDNDMRCLSAFFQVVNDNGSRPTLSGAELGGFLTEDWMYPPQLVGHNVSYGTTAEAVVHAALPNLATLPVHNEHYRHRPSAQFSTNNQTQPYLPHPFSLNAQRSPESYDHRPPASVQDVRFGSDPNFTRASFVPQSEKETTEAMMAQQLATLNCLEPTASAGPTRWPSPTSWAPPTAVRLQTIAQSPPPSDEVEHDDFPGRHKRRRTDGQIRDGSVDPKKEQSGSSPSNTPWLQRSDVKLSQTSPTISPTAGGVRRLPLGLIPTLDSAETSVAATAARAKKRRRSEPKAMPIKTPRGAGARATATTAAPTTTMTTTATKAKPKPRTTKVKTEGGDGAAPPASKRARVNLTEQQKRENHLRSEQHRRNIVKDGFEQLKAVLPALRDCPSKATTVHMTWEWLLARQAENEGLRRLAREHGIEVPPMPPPVVDL